MLTRLRGSDKLAALWIAFFLYCQCLGLHQGGGNAGAREAMLAAMAESQTFRIDPYVADKWTHDWAQTPDGAYYSNKAPGAAFLLFPIYYPLDRLISHRLEGVAQVRSINKARDRLFHWLSFLAQGVPFAALAWIFWKLRTWGEGPESLWGLVALLFGTTASIFMNTFFGHALAAVLALCLVLTIGRRLWTGVGLSFGWLLLTDYGAAMMIPALVMVFWMASEEKVKDAWKISKGAVLPASLWVWYHTVCFGSPFSLPNKFQNPIFMDMATVSHNLWGVIGFIPSGAAIRGLTLGVHKGLLWTQPWMLLMLGWLFWNWKKWRLSPESERIWFALVSFVGVFWMNASFGSWHGGFSSGPRYLSLVLPLFALLNPFKRWPKGTGYLLSFTVLAFFVFLSVEPLAPPNKTLLKAVLDKINGSGALRLSLMILPALLLYRRTQREIKGAHAGA